MKISAYSFSEGIFVSTMLPYAVGGELLVGEIRNQVAMPGSISGVLGVAINTIARERLCLTQDERLETIRQVRAGLNIDQLLLCCVGELSAAIADDVKECQLAGADAIIASPPTSDQCVEKVSPECLSDTAEQMPLPVIFTLGHGKDRWKATPAEISSVAEGSRKILGFDMGSSDNVLQYDQDYYAIKSVDRPIACLSSSDGTLFHNLNTGSDGVLSCLGAIAPYEVADLYRASREGCFSEAQALHNRLAPLAALLNNHDGVTHELVYREAAYHRGLLATPYARGISEVLTTDLRVKLHKTISDIGLRPVEQASAA